MSTQNSSIDDEDLMWRTQEINMTICHPLYMQLTECQQENISRFTEQQCKDISVLYNGCLLSAMDRKTKECMDKGENNPEIKSQRHLIQFVKNCLTNDEDIRKKNEELSSRLNEMIKRNPMRNILQKYRLLNKKMYMTSSKNDEQYKHGDPIDIISSKVSKTINGWCKQEHEALIKCVDELQKKGHDEFTPMCFKEMTQQNFCLSSIVCADQMSKCASYVNRQKKIHQVLFFIHISFHCFQEDYDFDDEEGESNDSYGFCLFTDSELADKVFKDLNECVNAIHEIQRR